MSEYNFVVITPGRSGSEHLRDMLSQYRDIDMSGEIFNQSNHEKASFNYFLKTDNLNATLAFFFNRQRLSGYKINYPLKHLAIKFLEQPISATSERVGFKLTLDQLNAYPFLLDILLDYKIQIVYLTRGDTLAMALSLINARESGIYQTREADMAIQARSFNVDLVKEQWLALTRWEADLLQELQEVDFLYISYETLFTSYQDSLSKIRAFLELSQSEPQGQSTLKKLNPTQLESWVLNLAEIKEAIAKVDINQAK